VRPLIVSFGREHPSKVTSQQDLSWDEFARLLTENPPEAEDKAAEGWFIPASFEQHYRNAENLIERHALTLDYDNVTASEVTKIQSELKNYAYAIYTTWTSTPEKPRVRVVVPTSRPMSADEFCAVSRRVASWAGIELAARESHVVAQMMYMPTRKPGSAFKSKIGKGQWLDVDGVLAQYSNWTDRNEWPKRKDHDSTYKSDELPTPPDEKQGVVGDFCRAFNVPQAIERFKLPYEEVSENRWTYTDGTRAEGAIVYDEGRKLHSHHDSDPARGQQNSFDLVRLHKFGALDGEHGAELPVTERPSFRAMVAEALQQPEVRTQQAASDFEVLPQDILGNADKVDAQPEGTAVAGEGGNEAQQNAPTILARHLSEVLSNPTTPSWLLRDIVEKGVIALIAGPRGSYKSFLALDWSMRCALRNEPVYVVSAEGGDFDRRAQAWVMTFAPERAVETLPLYVVERRLDLNGKDHGIQAIRDDVKQLAIKPVLFVLDTFSKLSGGLDENDNSQVKAFIGRLDIGLKRAYGATVLLVAHTGHKELGRARGASALGADTDSEYIVSRNELDGSVSVTRQRFKSSPELPPLTYQPDVVDLGRKDDEGGAVTSLVLRQVAAPATGATRALVLNKNQSRVMGVARELLAGKPSVVVTELLDAVVLTMPKDNVGRDRRRRVAKTAFEGLLEYRMLVLLTPDTVALNNVRVVGVDNFDEREDE